jgi:hypothetical protein
MSGSVGDGDDSVVSFGMTEVGGGGSFVSFNTGNGDAEGFSMDGGFVISKRSTRCDCRSEYCFESNETGGLNFRLYIKETKIIG